MNSWQGKRIALVLGSGGARGLAHVGVIQYLESQGCEISYISGCSMGAVVGGVYAVGRLEAFSEWVQDLDRRDVLGLLDFSWGAEGLFKGEKIIGKLREMTGECNIEDLDIGFTAVATDLYEQREVWLNHGPLYDAIRASMAIPSVFTPHVWKGRLLVDGGLLNPVPIAPALNHHADVIIAVNLNGRGELAAAPWITGGGYSRTHDERDDEPDAPSVFEAMAMSLDTVQTAITRLKLAAYTPDVMIDIPRRSCQFHEFHRGRELVPLGYERAKAVLGAAVPPDAST